MESDNKQKRCTEAEKQNRISKIYELLLSGTSRGDILQFSSEWDISERQIDSYISSAYKELKKYTENKRENAFNLHLERRENLYKLAMTKENHRIALAILKDEADLLNLYEQKGGTGLDADKQVEAFGYLVELMDKTHSGAPKPVGIKRDIIWS